MDLTVFKKLATAIEEDRLSQTKCGQDRNQILQINAPESIVQEFKKILFQNPGKKIPDLQDSFLQDGSSQFFFQFYICILHYFDIWKDETSTIDSAIALTKRLIDYTYDMTTGRLRLARLRQMWPQFLRWSVISRYEPHDFARTQKRSREELLYPDQLPKKLSFTILHALACLCTETIIQKPSSIGDNGLAERIQESIVYENDMTMDRSIFETIHQDMDAFAQTFSAQIHTASAITKLWVEAYPQMDLQHLKMKFESKPPTGSKDYATIQRNFLTQIALSWFYVKEIDHCSKNKIFKKLYMKLTQDAAAWAFTNSFMNCLEDFYKAKVFKMPQITYEKMSRLGEIMTQLVLRMSQIISQMSENRTLREQFMAMDYWTLRLSTSNPEHTIVQMKNEDIYDDISKPFIFWGFGPNQWTSLSMEQLGIAGLEGSEDCPVETFPKNHPFDNVMALMGVVMAFTFSMERLWAVLTNMDSWKAQVQLMDSWKKDREAPITVPLLQIFPDGEKSVKPDWMMTRQEMTQMRKDWKQTQNAVQKLKEEAIWGE